MTSQPLADGDRISDILSVVAAAQAAQEQSREPLPIRELRLGAIDVVATRELTREGRFKNLRSARNTIGGALARHLGVRSLRGFDSLLADWFRYGSLELEDAVLQECGTDDQRTRVRSVFQARGYVVESDGRLWILQRRGRYGTLASGATLRSIREQAFDRLRRLAPCSFRVVDGAPEEWRLDCEDGEWTQVPAWDP